MAKHSRPTLRPPLQPPLCAQQRQGTHTPHTHARVQDTLPMATQRQLRKTIVAAILCTDMTKHFALTMDLSKHLPLVRVKG